MRNVLYRAVWGFSVVLMAKVIYEVFAGRIVTGFDKIGALLVALGAVWFLAVSLRELWRRHK